VYPPRRRLPGQLRAHRRALSLWLGLQRASWHRPAPLSGRVRYSVD
jgi:hypothetical protein